MNLKKTRFVLGISAFLIVFCISRMEAQIALSSPATVTENFNSMATGTTLPANWRLHQSATPNWASGISTLSAQASSGSPSAGGSYNWGTSAGVDRSAGIMTSGSYASPNSYMAQYRNTSGATLNRLTITYRGERYRTNTALASIQFLYSLDGSTWNAAPVGDIASGSFPTGTSAYNFSTPLVVNVGPFNITGLSVANGGYIYLRWNFNTTGSNSQGIGIDDVDVTPDFDCPGAFALQFVQQPTNVAQNATMAPAVTVRAYCPATGFTNTSFSGNVSLNVNNGCGYVTQTVAAVDGVATFSSITFTRSTQSGLYFQASATGYTPVNSTTFNVTAPIGAPVTTVIKDENWNGGSPAWTYTIGTPGTVGSGGTLGTDVFGLTTWLGNTYLRKSYSVDNSSGNYGSINSATFSNVAGLAAYTTVTFSFQLASLNKFGQAINSGGGDGSGNDSGENLIIETELNGSGTWNTLLTHNGFSNKVFPFSATPVQTLAYNANATYAAGSTQSAFQVTLPGGTTSFRFRMIATNNRTEENWCIDNIQLIGVTYPVGSPFPLPVADAGDDQNICPGGSAQLSVNVTNTMGTVSYNWMPAATLTASNINNPVASPVVTTAYTVTITDGDQCTASDIVQVNMLSGAAGTWTGDFDDDWFNCKNWADGNVPTSATNVIISVAALNPANISILSPFAGSGIAYCNDIQITGKALILESTNSNVLEVHGNLSLSGTGQIDMDDGNAGTADGVLYLWGNWTNNLNESQFAEGNGTVQFVGTATQTSNNSVSLNESFYDVIINKASGSILLQSDLTILNSATFTQGVVDAFSNTREMVFRLNATALGVNETSFVEGRVRKIGNNAFTFPVGKLFWGYRPIGISAPSVSTDIFRCEYVRASARALGSITAPGLDHVSDCEYWWLERLGGTSTVNVIASWDTASCGVTSLPDLVVAHFDGTSWDDYGGAGSAVGTFNSGIVTWPGVTAFGRFTLGSTSAMNPLPVELLYFHAKKRSNTSVVCSWATVTEVNNDYFEIEVARNPAGVPEFGSLGRIRGQGNSSLHHDYSFVDENAVAGKNYYRLKQVDYDGSSTYSPVIIVNMSSARKLELHSIAPNPFELETRLYVQSNTDGNADLKLFDATGRLVMHRTQNIQEGASMIELQFADGLASGLYFLKLEMEGERIIRSLMKR